MSKRVSGPAELTEVDGSIYFSATDGVQGIELWKLAGTSQNPVLVKDILIGLPGAMPNTLTAVGKRLFFAAKGPEQDEQQPWVTDGSASGTRPLANAARGGDYRFPGRFTAVGEAVAFVASDAVGNERLWVRQPSGEIELVGRPLTTRLR